MNLKELFVFSTFLFSSYCLFCQHTDSIYVHANWNIGEKRAYKLIESEKDYLNGSLSEESTKDIYISFEILEKTDEGYLLNYSKDSVFIPGIDMSGQSQFLSQVLNKLQYKFTTDSYGEFVQLQNLEEIKENTIQLVDLFITSLEDENEIQKYLQIKKGVVGFLSRKELIENFILKEIGTIFGNYGYWIGLNDTIKYDTELSNPLGNGVIPASESLYAKLINDRSELVIESETTIDREIGKKLIIEYISEMAKTMELDTQDFNDSMKEANMNINLRAQTTYNLETGWAKEAIQIKNVIINDTNSITKKTKKLTIIPL